MVKTFDDLYNNSMFTLIVNQPIESKQIGSPELEWPFQHQDFVVY